MVGEVIARLKLVENTGIFMTDHGICARQTIPV